MRIWPIEFTPQLAKTITDRSAAGEGVIQVCKDLGLDPDDATEWLKEQHIGLVITAKKTQIISKMEAEASAKAVNEPA
jgi:UTP:GlnB (protein PII) uridylyltransferase